jgi:hypothetical protein
VCDRDTKALDLICVGSLEPSSCLATSEATSDSMQVMDQIQGRHGRMLPWEGSNLTPRDRAKLGVFASSVLKLLDRDPAKRPSMAKFCRICERVLSGSSMVRVDQSSSSYYSTPPLSSN